MLFQGSDFTYLRDCHVSNYHKLVKPRVLTNYNNFTKQSKVEIKKKNNGLYYSTIVLSGGFFIQNVRSVSVGVCFGGTLSESRGQGIGIRGPGPDRQLVQQEPGRIGQGHP